MTACGDAGEKPETKQILACSICWEQGVVSEIRTVPIGPRHTAGMDYLAEVIGARHVQATYEYRCDNGHVCGFMSDMGSLDIGITPP